MQVLDDLADGDGGGPGIGPVGEDHQGFLHRVVRAPSAIQGHGLGRTDVDRGRYLTGAVAGERRRARTRQQADGHHGNGPEASLVVHCLLLLTEAATRIAPADHRRLSLIL